MIRLLVIIVPFLTGSQAWLGHFACENVISFSSRADVEQCFQDRFPEEVSEAFLKCARDSHVSRAYTVLQDYCQVESFQDEVDECMAKEESILAVTKRIAYRSLRTCLDWIPRTVPDGSSESNEETSILKKRDVENNEIDTAEKINKDTETAVEHHETPAEESISNLVTELINTVETITEGPNAQPAEEKSNDIPPENPGKSEEPEKPNEPEKPVEPAKPNEPENPGKPEEPEKPNEPEQPVEPEKPNEPEAPEKPKEPEEPEKPNEPEKPAEPEKPNEPEKPKEPEKPAEPEKPNEPEKPKEPEEPEKPKEPEEPEKPTEPEEPIKPEKPEEPLIPEEPEKSEEYEWFDFPDLPEEEPFDESDLYEYKSIDDLEESDEDKSDESYDENKENDSDDKDEDDNNDISDIINDESFEDDGDNEYNYFGSFEDDGNEDKFTERFNRINFAIYINKK